jgi:hypothetical protein
MSISHVDCELHLRDQGVLDCEVHLRDQKVWIANFTFPTFWIANFTFATKGMDFELHLHDLFYKENLQHYKPALSKLRQWLFMKIADFFF